MNSIWKAIEKIIKHYQNIPEEDLYTQIFINFNQQIKVKAQMASNKAYNYSIVIPPEDFISYFQEAIWQSIAYYLHTIQSEYCFQQVVKRQIYLAEIRAWRDYQNKGTRFDKNQVQYLAAKYAPLKVNTPNINNRFKNFYIINQIKEFSTRELAAGAVIQMLACGYKPREVAKRLYNADKYSPKYRKRISRARKLFKIYLKSKV